MESIVDLSRYPLGTPDSAAYAAAVEKARRELKTGGLCVLENFLSPEGLAEAVSEARRLASSGFHNVVSGNPYLEDIDPSLPEGDPRRRSDTTALAAVAYDQFPKPFKTRLLYESDALLRFVGACVRINPLYRYGCPLGGLNLAVMKDGDHLRWHFDKSDFVVSIPLQEPQTGGVYEYVHNLRSPEEPRYEKVRAVLEGDRSAVQILSTPPGSLILFEGRNTLHRVTEIKGDVLRLVLLLGYADDPKTAGSDFLRKIRYGRIS